MARSVNFTVDEISSFISGLDGVASSIDRSISEIQRAVANTETRLGNAIREYEEQLYEIEQDESLAYSARISAENAERSARAELDRLYEARAKMSEEEQRANSSTVSAAEKKHEAMENAYQAVDRIYKYLMKRAEQTREAVSSLDSNLRSLRSAMKKFDQAAYGYSRLLDQLKDAANGARTMAEQALEALAKDSGYYETTLRINISNVNALNTFAVTVGDFAAAGKEGLERLSDSAKEAEFLMQSAIMSAAGGKTSEIEYEVREATRGLREFGKRAEIAYSALDSYLRYGNITVR